MNAKPLIFQSAMFKTISAIVIVVAITFVYALAGQGMPASQFAQQLFNAVSLGAIYALIAIGYTMVYSILNMINFAHGDIFMMSLYFAFFSVTLFHMPWPIGFIVSLVVTAAMGVTIEKLAYKPLRTAPKNSVLVSAIGASFLLENLATYLFSGRPQAFPEIPVLMTGFSFGEVSVRLISLVTIAVTVVSLLILTYIIHRTKTGMAMRAVSTDFEIARTMGINENTIVTLVFIIGSALAAIGGFLWGVKYTSILPLMGIVPGMKCFIAAVVGGIGNIAGAVLGGFIIGMSEILAVALFPSISGYRDVFAFVMLIVILMVKPAGLLGTTATEKV
jgi:branched-chain amino acid transport system permease protein